MTSPYSATVAALGAAALLAYAVKRAALGTRPFLASVRCWVKDSHSERKQAVGGSKCEWCGLAFADLGSVSPMRVTYERRHGQITRSSW